MSGANILASASIGGSTASSLFAQRGEKLNKNTKQFRTLNESTAISNNSSVLTTNTESVLFYFDPYLALKMITRQESGYKSAPHSTTNLWKNLALDTA